MKKTNSYIGTLMMVAAMVTVGSTVPASALIGSGLGAVEATLIRFAVATPILLLLARMFSGSPPKLGIGDWGLLVVQAAAGSVAYTMLLILGLRLTSGTSASVVVGTLPIVMGLVAVTFLGERSTVRFFLALGLAGAGVLLLVLPVGSVGGGDRSVSLLGLMFVFGAVLCETTFLLLNRKMTRQLPPLWQASFMSGFGFILILPLAGVMGFTGDLQGFGLFSTAFYSVVYYALVPTVLGFALWYGGSALSSARSAALAAATMPISAIVLSALVLGETLAWREAIACFLVTVGLLMGAMGSLERQDKA